MSLWRYTWLILLLSQLLAGQQSRQTDEHSSSSTSDSALSALFESKVKAEWEAFKNKDKKTYSDLLADDFVAVEDDNEGMRNRSAAIAEVDHSVVSNYFLIALKVVPLGHDAALVTYELTLQFPPKAQVRFKRVLVSEVWLKRKGEWKERYYQETHAR
jgi:hypothetical protein